MVLVLDRGDRLVLGDQQRGHRRGTLEGLHVVGGDRPLDPDTHQTGEVGAARSHPQPENLPLAGGRGLADHPLDPDPAGGLDEVVLLQQRALRVAERGGALPAVGGRDHDAGVERAGHLVGDADQVAALEHDLGEPGVQRVDARQPADGAVSYQDL